MATDTRERILEATARLVQQHGLHGTTLNRILAASDAPRGSIYFHFPGGKDEIVLEAMLAGVARVNREIETLLRECEGPAEAMRAYMDAAAAELEATDYVFGCPVAPVILDCPPLASRLAEACRETIDGWQQGLADYLAASGAARDRAERLAALFIAALEGGLIMARARRDVGALTVVADEIEALIRREFPERYAAAAGA